MRLHKKNQIVNGIIIPFMILVSIYFLGVVGYLVIEDLTLLEALFMSIITITTVGYSLVKPLSTAGTVFTIFLIIFGTGTVAYIIIKMVDYFLTEIIKGTMTERRTKKMLSRLKNHYIICGIGRVGLSIAKELERSRKEFVIIDNAQDPINISKEKNWPFIQGDASLDETLEAANISNAKCLFAALDSDPKNVFVTLSAKSLNPSIFIVARSTLAETKNKLIKAGADRVISPQTLGGRRMASLAMHPTVCDFFDTAIRAKDDTFKIAEIAVMPKSRIDGIPIKMLKTDYRCEALILSILKNDEELLYKRPDGDTVIHASQKLIAIGSKEEIDRLSTIALD